MKRRTIEQRMAAGAPVAPEAIDYWRDGSVHITDAPSVFGMSHEFWKKRADAGEIVSATIGRRFMLSRRSICEYLAAHTNDAAPLRRTSAA